MGLNGLGFCLVSAAAFFVTYDCTKSLLGRGQDAARMAPVNHMLAASLGEVVGAHLLVSTFFVYSKSCVAEVTSPG